jgi:DNA-binding PadR family transcriptional regulator
MAKGFVLELKSKTGKTYAITDKGQEYLSKFSLIKDFTSSFGLE